MRDFEKDPIVCKVCKAKNKVKIHVERGSHEVLTPVELWPGGPVRMMPIVDGWRHKEPNDYGTFGVECTECGNKVEGEWNPCMPVLLRVEHEFEGKELCDCQV